MREIVAKDTRAAVSGAPLAGMLWLILLIIFAMWAVPHYVGQPLARI